MPARSLRMALVACMLALGGTAQAIDLVDAYANALRFDPGRKAADEALLAGREKAVQGAALLKPRVTLSASVSQLDETASTRPSRTLREFTPPESSGRAHQATLQLVQPVYAPRDRADKRQLEQQTALAETGGRQAEQDLLQRVGDAYFGVLLAEEGLRVSRAEKVAVGLQRDRAQARFDVGRGRITDLQEAQARYDGVLAKELSAQSTLELSRAQFQELTGVPAEGLAALAPGFVPVPPEPDSLQAWQLKGLDRNPRVLAQRSEVEIAAAEIEKHRLSGRPTLDVVARHGYRGQAGGVSPSVSPDSGRSTSIGLQFSIPLYTGGALNSREREAIAKQREAEHDLAGAQRDVRLQVQDAYLAVKTGVSRIAALEQSVRSAQTALEATVLGRDLGTRTELDVLDAQQRLYSVQFELAQSRHDYLRGRLQLASAAGELHEGDLRALNAYLVR